MVLFFTIVLGITVQKNGDLIDGRVNYVDRVYSEADEEEDNE